MDNIYMFKIMGIILGVVFFLIAIIVVVFCVKSCRQRRENLKKYKDNHRSQQRLSLHIDHYDFDAEFRSQSTHQPTYGRNMSRDQDDDNTLSIDSPSTQNGTYINNSAQVHSDSMYDLPKSQGGVAIPITVNIEYQNEENTLQMSTFESGILKREMQEKLKIRTPHGNKANIPDNKNKRSNNQTYYSQSLNRYNERTRGDVGKTLPHNFDNLEYPDYENSPEMFRKQLTTIPPQNNNKMIGIHDNSTQSKSQEKMKLAKQDSDYEDPDKVVAIRTTGMKYGSYNLRNVNKDNATHSENPEYSNLQNIGVVVKSGRFASAPMRDYVNENVIEDLKKTAPPVPNKKRAHTTTTYDRPHRPVLVKMERTFSHSDDLALHQDDIYVPMDGTHDEDDMYIPMDSNENVKKVTNKQLNTSLTRSGEIVPPARCPKPSCNMVPKRSFDKNYTLNVKPPPCGVGKKSNTEYVNYDENSKYVNLFKSKSIDDIYVYADARDDVR